MKDLFIILLFLPLSVKSQDLEPRSLSNAPIGMNFILVGYGYSVGNILFDTSEPIKDASAHVNSTVAAYARTIDVFGLSGKVDIIVPFVFDSYWEGLVNGQQASTTRIGFTDPSVRLSVNFIGSPSLRLNEFKEYQERTIVGASLRILMPAGQYSGEKIINLGTNRWTLKPQIGVSKRIDHWVFEGYAGVWLFTTNHDFLGKKMTQKPISTLTGHLCYIFKKGIWIAVDGGYGFGGRTTVDELPKESQENIRVGATLALPVARQHALKLNFTSGIDTRIGADFDSFTVVYQYRWGGIKKI